MYRAILLTVTALSTFGSTVRADNREEHVRVTEDGTKVVDYVADLEADNDVLKRQVMALQNELEHRSSQPVQKSKIEIVERKVPVEIAVPDPKLESALKEKESRLRDLESVIRNQKADLSATNERNQQLAAKVGEKDRMTADQQQKIQALRSSELEYSRQLKEYKENQLRLQEALNKQLATQTTLKEQQELLVKDLEVERQHAKQGENTLKNLQSKVALYEKQLDGEVDKRRQIEQELAQEKLKVASLNTMRVNPQPQAETLVPSQRRKLEIEVESTSDHQELVTSDARPRLSLNAIPKQTTSASVASSALKDLLAVQDKIRMRDELFRNYQSSKPPVIIRPSRVISRDGNSIAELESIVRHSDDGRNTTQIKRSLREIESQLDEDIAIIQRLTRK